MQFHAMIWECADIPGIFEADYSLISPFIYLRHLLNKVC